MAAATATDEDALPREAGEALAAAVAHVRGGSLLAFPTETVWGLGADARSAPALARLHRWKGRSDRQPMSVLVPDAATPAVFGAPLDGPARRLAAAFWPGPLTLVVPAPPGTFAPGVARADGAVGLRCSPHPQVTALVAALLRAGVGPLTATSLNRHGEPPARNRAEASALCGDADAPRCLDLGEDEAGSRAFLAPSTVVDCTGARPVLLRVGAIAPAELERVLDQEIATP
jgi:L-threonylcarbamoyladenylate synthase